MKIHEIQLTPELAATLLQGNTDNRSLSQQRVAAYAADMASGNWNYDGAPIRRSVSGRLIDGQHRCAGVVRSGVTIPAVLIDGLADDVQLTMDTGKPRSFGDYLTFRGVIDPTARAAITGLLWKYEQAAVDYRGDWMKRPVATPPLLAELYERRHAEIELALALARRAGRFIHCSRTVLAVGYIVFSDLSADDADHFYQQLAEETERASAVVVFTRTMNTRETAHQARGLMEQSWQLAYLIKAWNAFREGREISILRWTRGGKTPEPFPEPK